MPGFTVTRSAPDETLGGETHAALSDLATSGHPWDAVSGKPATFAPDTHAHSAHSGIGAADHHAAFVQADHDALANPHHSNANDHANTNDPTTDQKAALAGTGTPSGTDKYVNDSDARNTNARTPTAHASTHTTGSDKIATGTPDGTKFLRDDFAWAAPTAAHPDLATHDTLGLATQAELDAHASAADPHTAYALDSDLTTHSGAADPHTGYQKESEKGAASGYASLDASTLVPTAQLGTGVADGTKVLKGDRTWGAGGSGAPTDADYLIGTAHADLSAEIVVGTAPGGELGGTWAAPTVDATHSGSAHHTRGHDPALAADHPVSGLTTNHVLTALSATTIGWQAAAGGNDPRIVTKELTANEISDEPTDTTMGKVVGLDQSVGVGTWWFEYRCVYRSSATGTGVKFGVNFSGTQTLFVVEATGSEATTAASTGAMDQVHAAFGLRSGGGNRAPSTSTAIFGSTSVDTASADMLTVIKGVIKVTVAGDLQLYFGSEATGSTQTIMAGSALRLTKVSA